MFNAQITFISVADLDRSHGFYAGVLGLPLVLDQGRCRIYRAAPSAHLGTCDTRSPVPGTAIFTLVTDRVDAMASRLRNAGYAPEVGPRANAEFGIYQFFVRDPDGYLLEIQRFDDPEWDQIGRNGTGASSGS